ncbi:hypothetical protein LTR08_007247 [Meristemomyces frigidus]|nr:hypothetical protein LTR08_007247 [Meristemomyces frigidus]
MGHQGGGVEGDSAPGGACTAKAKLAAGIVRFIIIFFIFLVGAACTGVDLCGGAAKVGRWLGIVPGKKAAFAAKMLSNAGIVALGVVQFVFGVLRLRCEKQLHQQEPHIDRDLTSTAITSNANPTNDEPTNFTKTITSKTSNPSAPAGFCSSGATFAAGVIRYILILLFLAAVAATAVVDLCDSRAKVGRSCCGLAPTKRAAFAAKMISLAVSVLLGFTQLVLGIGRLLCADTRMGQAWAGLDLVWGFVPAVVAGVGLGLEPVLLYNDFGICSSKSRPLVY